MTYIILTYKHWEYIFLTYNRCDDIILTYKHWDNIIITYNRWDYRKHYYEGVSAEADTPTFSKAYIVLFLKAIWQLGLVRFVWGFVLSWIEFRGEGGGVFKWVIVWELTKKYKIN